MSETHAVLEQLAETSDSNVREAYLGFADWHGDTDLRIRPDSHGFIARELRFEASGQWYYSAVLNKSWVLWYFRWPAFRDHLIDRDQTLARFPFAQLTKYKDVKLRVKTRQETAEVLEWISR